jgi:hypothetical protein
MKTYKITTINGETFTKAKNLSEIYDSLDKNKSFEITPVNTLDDTLSDIAKLMFGVACFLLVLCALIEILG